MSDSKTNGEATESFQQPVHNASLATTATFAKLATNGISPVANIAYVNATITTSSSVIFLNAFVEVAGGSENCKVAGSAFSVPRA